MSGEGLGADEIQRLEDASWKRGAAGWRAEIVAIIDERTADLLAALDRAEARLAAVEALADERAPLADHRICNADYGRVTCYCSAIDWMTLDEYGEHLDAIVADALDRAEA